MSPSYIAKPIGKKLIGRYCVSGSHPQRQSYILLRAVASYFDGDVEKAQEYLVDAHPAGWYRLGQDFNLPPGFTGSSSHYRGNQCYCHGLQPQRREWALDPVEAKEAGAQWAYVLHPRRLQILTPIRDGWLEVRSLRWTKVPRQLQRIV